MIIISICLSSQEEKIAALQSFADQLVSADHYAKPEIFNRRNEVLDRSGFFFLMLLLLSESVPFVSFKSFKAVCPFDLQVAPSQGSDD